jgi:hypothetical protein
MQILYDNVIVVYIKGHGIYFAQQLRGQTTERFAPTSVEMRVELVRS